MKTETCEFGFRVAPDAGRHPGVVLIHDVWGLSDHTRDIATRLSSAGFHVLAIDLYRDFANQEIGNPGAWIRELCDPEIVADLCDAAKFLASHPDSAHERVAIVGFCMGGMYALLAGCNEAGEIAAVVPFYGLLSHSGGLLGQQGGLDPARKPVEPIEAGKRLRCPMLAFFGEDDPYVSSEDVDRLEASVAQSGQPTECIRYAGAGHAFMNDTYPDAYRPEAASDAWQRMLAFLRAKLA